MEKLRLDAGLRGTGRVRWCESGDPTMRIGLVCTGRVRWCESGVHRTRSLWSSRASGVAGAGARVLAVGGNGRVQTASDTVVAPQAMV